MLPTIIVALFAVSWSPADASPKAPPPHAKKTKAEQLVGEWKLVERDGQLIPETGKYYLEFTADGKLHIFTEDRLFPPAVVFGTYKLIGDTIHFHTPMNREGKEQRWEAKIDLITDEGLSITAKRDNLSAADRYRRVMSESNKLSADVASGFQAPLSAQSLHPSHQVKYPLAPAL